MRGAQCSDFLRGITAASGRSLSENAKPTISRAWRRHCDGPFRVRYRQHRSEQSERGPERRGQRVKHRTLVLGRGFSTPYTRGQVEPLNRYLQLSWALPTGSPADFPMVLNYNSNAGTTTEYGVNWSAPYHRYAEPATGGRCQGVQPSGRGDIQPPDCER